jgi:AraC family ethanolamine operon transcriptional activator
MNLAPREQPEIHATPPLVATEPSRIALAVFDPDLLAEAVRGAGFEHRQLNPGHFSGALVRAEVGGLIIDRGCYSQALLARGAFSPSSITVGFLLSDREPGHINGIRARTQDLIVFPENGELDYVLPAYTEWCSVQIERNALLALGVDPECIEGMSVISPHAGQHGRLAHLMRFALDGLASTQAQHAFRDTLLEELYQTLSLQRGHCRHPNFSERANLVRRFERLAEAQYGERRSIADLALSLGVARRTLELAFRDYIGLSPARYLSVLRLNAMHRELLKASEDNLRVADLAARFGIVHLGRFASDYRHMFGELPSQTLRRAHPHSHSRQTDEARRGLPACQSARTVQPAVTDRRRNL